MVLTKFSARALEAGGEKCPKCKHMGRPQVFYIGPESRRDTTVPEYLELRCGLCKFQRYMEVADAGSSPVP